MGERLCHRGGGRLLLIDCGTDWEPGREALREGLKELGLDESGVHTLVVSHLHPDHVGMASRLVAGLGCQFVMHEIAAERVDGYNDTPGYVLRLIRIGQRHGVPLSILDTVSEQIGDRPSYMPPTGLASVGFKRSEEPISDDGSRMGDA